MYKFIAKRVIQGIVVIWGVITIVFIMRFMTPGDPVNFVVPLDASDEVRDQVARDLGLDQPVHVQYTEYVLGLLQGDMGYSYISGVSASTRILSRLPATIELAVAATVIAVVISIPLGIISATRRNTRSDYLATGFSLFGISTPNFWLGIMLILLFSELLGLFPTSRRPVGFVPAMELLVLDYQTDGIVTWARHITLPAITMGTFFTALIMRLTRNGMIEELGKLYVQALRAKGLPEAYILYGHALKNALIPIVTVIGLQLGGLIGGAVVVETVFSWNGLGLLLIDSVFTRDWPLIQGCLIVIGVGYVTINTVVDVAYTYINPKVELQ